MKKKKQPRKNWLFYTGTLLGILLLAYVGYSVWYYLQSTEDIEEFEVCYEDHCVKTFHIHSTIEIDLCGKPGLLSLESGPIEESHSHKERNYIHFHERLPYDPKTQQLLDTTPLKLGETLKGFGISFNNQCIKGMCLGEPCDGKPGTISLMVNGQENTLFDQYVWKDDDKILISFTSR